MKCLCGGYARIVSTEGDRRRRKCGSCGKNFFTTELRESEADHLGVQAMQRLIGTLAQRQARETLRLKGYLK